MERLFSMRTVYLTVAIAAAVLSATYYLMKLRQECGADPLLRCIRQALGSAPPAAGLEEPRGAAGEARQLAAEKERAAEDARKAVAQRDREEAERRAKDGSRRVAEEARARDASFPRLEALRLIGAWRGTYLCAQGPTGLTLTIEGTADALTAEFDFYPLAENPRVPSGRFRMSGVFDGRSRTLDLRPGQWIVRPEPYMTVGLRAEVDLDAGVMSGTITDPACGSLRLTRLQPAGLPPGRGN